MSYFLDLLIIARIVPTFKSNGPLLLNNYLPIPLLSFFSRIFEKYLCKHIIAIASRIRKSYVSNNVVLSMGY